MRPLDPSTQTKNMSWLLRADRCLFALGGFLFVLQGLVLTSLATNLPFSDGWTVLRSHCLENAIQWPWVWELHNEHRLVWTKLLHWLNYRYLNYSLVGQAAANYVIYAALVWSLLDLLKRKFSAPPGLMLICLSSALVWEIHFWGFQTHFLLYPLCLVMSLRGLLRDDWYSWSGVLWAAAGVYTMANGVLAAGCCALFCATKAALQPRYAKRVGLQAFLIALSIVPWSVGFQKNPGHPDFAGPWTKPFWWHLGLTFTQGFGIYNQKLAWLGVLLFVGFLALWAARMRVTRHEARPQQLAWLALASYSCAMLLSVGVTSMARAGLGGPTPRYCFPVVLLVPVFWTLLHYDWLRRPWHFVLFAVALLVPLKEHFRYDRIYRDANQIIEQHRSCIHAYYRGENNGDCPGSYPGNLTEILELAREMRLPFTQDMLPLSEQYTDTSAKQLSQQYCHMDGIDNVELTDESAGTPYIVHKRQESVKMMGWAWDPDRYYPQNDIAVELDDGSGRIYALSATRFQRQDLRFFRGSFKQQWGLRLDMPTPALLPNGLYSLRIRQGHGIKQTTCALKQKMLVTG